MGDNKEFDSDVIEINDNDSDSYSDEEINRLFSLKYKKVVDLKENEENYGLHLSLSNNFQNLCVGFSSHEAPVYQITNTGLVKNANCNRAKGAICKVRFFNQDPNLLLLASTNGETNLIDLRSADKNIHTFQDISEGVKKTLTSIDINQNDRVLCASTDVQKSGDCFLLFYDIRERKYLGSYWESHSEDITAVKFHSTNPDHLITGGIDGLINMFDISKPDEDDAMINCFNMERCIEKLYWHKDPNDKDLISCISTMNDLQFFNEENLDLEIGTETLTQNMRRKSSSECNLVDMHNNENGEPFLLASSNFNNGECLRALKFENKEMVPYANFQGNDQIVRASAFCDTQNFMITTGENGTVNLWKPERLDSSDAEEHTSHKIKQKMHISGHRLKPY